MTPKYKVGDIVKLAKYDSIKRITKIIISAEGIVYECYDADYGGVEYSESEIKCRMVEEK